MDDTDDAMTHAPTPPTLLFVSALSRPALAERYLLASECLAPGRQALALWWNARSAAEAVNAVLDSRPQASWVVWLHEDVKLPEGWDARFKAQLQQALVQWPNLAVAGVYGVAGAGPAARRAGHVLDRGQWLHEPAALPCAVDSLDELLLAVRTDSGLRLDPALGFDFYATDLVLQAQQAGWTAAVLDAPCEHGSSSPRSGPMPRALVERFERNGSAFERKWAHRLPLSTPCVDIARPGDVSAFVRSFPIAGETPE